MHFLIQKYDTVRAVKRTVLL